MLVQTPDRALMTQPPGKVVTHRQPTEQEWRDLQFAWNAARLVKSNAIVFARDRAIVGLGAGQPNRLESVGLAHRKAGEKAFGAAMASDAFFPFADGVVAGLQAGISSVIQPGGIDARPGCYLGG
jgi:phosphoribosylaminoimidazolecarboxamide formyltransferase/IMP cyclohydrolase